MDGLGWLGLVPDVVANQAQDIVISAPESRVVTAVIPTDEEAVILRALRELTP